MTFLQACKKKFEKGKREHKQPWNLEHIDARKEMQQELCDLYNYFKLYSEIDRLTALQVMSFCKEMWERLEK